MPNLTAEQLKKVSLSILRAAGAPGEVAERVSWSLVESNLVGHDTHGIKQLTDYIEDIREGGLDPEAKIEVVEETSTTALIDGKWGFGQVAAAEAMRIAIEKAEQHHLSAVCIFRCNHIGRLGEYPMMAAERGLIGITMCNDGPPGGLVAPFGGMKPVFSTNPIAVAIPAGEKFPFLLDFATSACAENKLRVLRDEGGRIPKGWILDKEGRPSTDPADFYEGGVLLPFGGHKGYGLCLLVEILGGMLTGAGCAALPDFNHQHPWGNGTFMMAINIEAFKPLEEFKTTVDRLFRRVKEPPIAPGFEEILIPGEPEFRARQRRLEEGIFISDRTWKDIAGVAENLGMNLEEILN